MTLIAVACKGDHAEFITDTATYLPNAREFQRTTKFTLLPHLDAAILNAGPGDFTALAQLALSGAASIKDADFDGLAADAPCLLNQVREDIGAEEGMASHVILVGYSTRAGCFVAYRYSSADDFEPASITSLYVQPHLWSVGPADDEAGRAAAAESRYYATARVQGDVSEVHAALDAWEAKPPQSSVPGALKDWIRLAEQARQERSLMGPWMRAYIAGELLYGRLERELATVSKIWEFNDQGDEFAQMVAQSDHPIAQVADCWCGSGKNVLACCRADDLAEPCGCGSGEPFGDCCIATAGGRI